MQEYAEIIINRNLPANKSTLTYAIPQASVFKPGDIVEIPFRKAKIRGIITSIHNNKPAYALREIICKTENAPHLNEKQLKTAEFISDYYLCSLNKVIKLFIPVGIFNKKKIKVPPFSAHKSEKEAAFKLSEEQSEALKSLAASNKSVTLLHGITGSGKTEIYRRLTEIALADNKQVLILVPEIALTPQTVRNFEKKFGKNIAIIHSRLTPAQKEKYWQLIYRKELQIVIGSRSALFAPFDNLGLIVIDEEHEDSYKQDQAPRYHAVHVAKKLAQLHKAKVVLGSATPSIESYFAAKSGEYDLIEMNKRIDHSGENSLPKIEVVDMREELKKKNFSIFSETLHFELTNNLKKSDQSILFLNRRGAASAVICRDCGHVEKCPHCQIAYTYHNKIHVEDSIWQGERLICHHCGKFILPPQSCPNCHSHLIKHIGIGTQKVEDETAKAFPDAKILRADKDTTRTRESFEKIYDDFKNQKANILIGTQMIGKGLHLPSVTLVGVMIADTTLTIPDYRSAEKTFQLLTQVAGRSGREKPGKVIIQTYLPDHYAIRATLNHDYLGFYNKELVSRQFHRFPPFNKLVKLTISDKNAQKALAKATRLSDELNEYKLNVDQNTLLESINTYPALMVKFKNQYRHIILLSGKNPRLFLQNFSLHHKLDDDIKIDVDPIHTV